MIVDRLSRLNPVPACSYLRQEGQEFLLSPGGGALLNCLLGLTEREWDEQQCIVRVARQMRTHVPLDTAERQLVEG